MPHFAVVVGAVMLGATIPGFAAASIADASDLTFVGADQEPRVVALDLHAGKPEAGSKGSTLQGDLRPLLRNNGDSKLQVRIRYARDAAAGVETLPSGGKVVTWGTESRMAPSRLDALGARLMPLISGGRVASGEQASLQVRRVTRVLARLGGVPNRELTRKRLFTLSATLRRAFTGGVTAAETAAVARALRRIFRKGGMRVDRVDAAGLQQVLERLARHATEGRATATDARRLLAEFDRLFSQSRYPVVLPKDARQLPLHFTLPASEQPKALDGTLIVDSFKTGGARPIEQVTLAIAGQAEAIGDVRSQPSKVIIQADRGCIWPFACPGTQDADVRLVGSGVAQLLSDLRAAGDAAPAVRVAHTDGQEVMASLVDLKADGVDPELASGRIVLDADPPAGKLAGDISLSSFAPESPVIGVEAHSHVWIGWAIVLIFVGIVFAGWLLQHYGLDRQRNLIRGWLREAVAEYDRARDLNEFGDEKLIWEPEIELPLEDDPQWTYFRKLETARSIYTAARWARNDADLEEVQVATAALTERVTIWLATVKLARQLTEVNGEHRPNRVKKDWPDTQTARHTGVLLHSMKRAPNDAAAGRSMIVALGRQVLWHRAYAQTWDLMNELERRDPTPQGARNVDIDIVDKDLKAPAMRTAEEQDGLEVAIRSLHEELTAIAVPEAGSTSKTPPLEMRPTPDVARLEEDLAAMELYRHAPATAMTQMMINRMVSAETQTVAAAAGSAASAAGPPAPAAAHHQDGLFRRLTNPTVRRFERLSGSKRMWKLWGRDLAVTLVILLLTSLVYLFAKYGDTWGSLADLGTAFLAGFAGHAAVKWAALPLYRSVRMRTAAAPAAKDAGLSPAAQ